MNQAREIADLVDRIKTLYPGASVLHGHRATLVEASVLQGHRATLVEAWLAGRNIVLLRDEPSFLVGERVYLSDGASLDGTVPFLALSDAASEFMDRLSAVYATTRTTRIIRGSTSSTFVAGGDDEGDDADAIGDFYDVEREE